MIPCWATTRPASLSGFFLGKEMDKDIVRYIPPSLAIGWEAYKTLTFEPEYLNRHENALRVAYYGGATDAVAITAGALVHGKKGERGVDALEELTEELGAFLDELADKVTKDGIGDPGTDGLKKEGL